MLEKRETYHQYIHFGLLCVLVAAIPYSMFLMSSSLIALFLNWLLRGNYKIRFANRQNNIILGSVLLLYIVHLIWLLNTENFSYGFHDLRIKLPILVLPLILFTSPLLSEKQEKYLFAIYVLSVFFLSLVVFYKGMNLLPLRYREAVFGISHIRFSLNVCFTIFIVLLNLKQIYQKSRVLSIFSSIIVLWLFGILLLLQSYTGLIIFLVVILLLLFRNILFSKSNNIKWVSGLTVFLVISAVTSICVYEYKAYYDLKPLSAQQMPTNTKLGNPYNMPNYRMIEDGNYIDAYVCDSELKEEWEKRSSLEIDAPIENYSLKSVLIRYLNSKGLTKDAEGVKSLTEKDIKLIESGIPNVSYADRFGVRKLFSTFFFQWESYSSSRDAKGSSVFQRVELWKTGYSLVKQHFFVGVGTGDIPDAIKAQLIADNSSLKETNLRCHNQYLTFAVGFGIIGLLFALASLFYGAFKLNFFKENILFLVFFSIILLSMCSEDTLETQAGCMFFAFFYAYFLSRASQKKYGEIPVNALLKK